jgi:lysyl-tRNA synthetase class 2
VIARLQRRARALAAARAFFEARGVMEVQTGALVARAVTDPHIESLAVELPGGERRFLHSSPEYAMKRLLVEGSGDIYQIAPVWRAGERGPWHNPEFTMIEWYRTGFGLDALMRETAALAGLLLGRPADEEPELIGFAQAFERVLGIDVFGAPVEDLAAQATAAGLAATSAAGADRDTLLDFLVATRVGPALGHGVPACLHHYPASQAALARLDPSDPRTALRFELYHRGVELANGFVELGDAAEQARRFANDDARRGALGRPRHRADERLLAALERGMPECAGVALGLDRVLMLAAGSREIDEVLALPWDEA